MGASCNIVPMGCWDDSSPQTFGQSNTALEATLGALAARTIEESLFKDAAVSMHSETESVIDFTTQVARRCERRRRADASEEEEAASSSDDEGDDVEGTEVLFFDARTVFLPRGDAVSEDSLSDNSAFVFLVFEGPEFVRTPSRLSSNLLPNIL